MIRTGIKSFTDLFPYSSYHTQSALLRLNLYQYTKLLQPFVCLSTNLHCGNPKSSWPVSKTFNPGGSSARLNYANHSALFFFRDSHFLSTEKSSSTSGFLLAKMNENTPDQFLSQRHLSNDVKTADEKTEQEPDKKDKKGRFKVLIRDYGATAVIFHVTISLASLGICWLLVNSSLPMEDVFIWLGIDKKLGGLTEAASTSTNFVVAYAVHKSFALVRLSITAACVPVVVRFLRAKGILKPAANAVKK